MKFRWAGSLAALPLCACVAQTGDLSTPSPTIDPGGDASMGSGGSSGVGAGGAGGDMTNLGGSGGTPAADGGPGASAAPYCVVRQMLTARCVRCHTNPPVAGAPMSLLAYVDLLFPARSNPARTVAEVALDRIQSTTAPMPPAPAPPAVRSEIQALQDWINAGTPQSRCSGAAAANGSAVDAGSGGGRDGAADAATLVDPFSVGSRCTSNARWTSGNNFNMRPGEPCLNCHGNYSIIGTVYPTGHEPNDCNGFNGTTTDAVVVITDANGAIRNLPVNAVGNFELASTVATPFRAKVTYAGRERTMTAAQTNGNCNSCHTPNGSGGAPGRIVLP